MNNQLIYGLLEIDLKSIIAKIKSNPRINKIILFGSRAKGTHHLGSDIDLAIDGNDLTSNDLINISIELDALFLPYKFDLVIFNRIKEPALIEHIKRVGVVL